MSSTITLKWSYLELARREDRIRIIDSSRDVETTWSQVETALLAIVGGAAT